MNQLTIIGNVAFPPQSRVTSSGANVTTFSVAVNGRNKEQTNFFRISAWNKLGDLCMEYLTKGRKVCVVGEVTARIYQPQNGEAKAQLEVRADHVEFLSPREERDEAPAFRAELAE